MDRRDGLPCEHGALGCAGSEQRKQEEGEKTPQFSPMRRKGAKRLEGDKTDLGDMWTQQAVAEGPANREGGGAGDQGQRHTHQHPVGGQRCGMRVQVKSSTKVVRDYKEQRPRRK